MRTLTSLLAVAVLSFAACATTGTGDEVSDVEGESATTGKLDLWQATDGQWHFHLKSGNGAILLTSEAYTSRTGAITGALSTLDNGVDPAQYALAPAAHGYVLHLVAGNNAVIGVSEVYATRSSATRAVASCVRATTSYLDRREAVTTGARVTVEAGESGQFHFNVFAKNGQIVVSSERYATEAAAYNGAFAVQAAGQAAAGYTVKQAASGTWYFTIAAPNGEIVGTSQQYTTQSSAKAAVTAVTNLLPTITVL
ncbi:MAG: YegP family protein [Proteobacteria bacterium]|nr:YegP family protein [Pseudomonadota bacterium]